MNFHINVQHLFDLQYFHIVKFEYMLQKETHVLHWLNYSTFYNALAFDI